MQWVVLLPPQQHIPKTKARNRRVCGSDTSSDCQKLPAKNDIGVQPCQAPWGVHKLLIRKTSLNELWNAMVGLASTPTKHSKTKARDRSLYYSNISSDCKALPAKNDMRCTHDTPLECCTILLGFPMGLNEP